MLGFHLRLGYIIFQGKILANPQTEEGYVKIANELFDAMARIRIPGEAMQVLLVIMRKTYGWNKKEDFISLSQIVEMTGISKRNIIRAREKLESMNIISVVKKDNKNSLCYRFQKNYDAWKPLSKRTTLSKKTTPVVKKDNELLSKKTPTKDIYKDTIQKTKEMAIIQIIFTKWNDFAEINKLSKMRTLEGERLSNLKTRMKNKDFDFDLLLVKVSESEFLLGKVKKWRADFKFIVSKSGYQKIMEDGFKSVEVEPKEHMAKHSYDE